jgi:aryl-alcohol dehydrogenase
VAVWGAGGVGLAAVMAFALSSPHRLLVVDTQRSRLDLALSLGATHAVLASDDAVARVRELTDGDMLDFALDCVGHPAVAGTAHRCLASGGTVVTVGSATTPGATPDIDMVDHLVGSKAWIGSHQGNSNPQVTIPLLVSLWRSGKFPVEKLLKSCAPRP